MRRLNAIARRLLLLAALVAALAAPALPARAQFAGVDGSAGGPGPSSSISAMAGANVGGIAYQDVNTNGAYDAGEPGVGSGAWLKLVSGGTAVQVVQPDLGTGAYSFSSVANGSYTIVLDDNGTAGGHHSHAASELDLPQPRGGVAVHHGHRARPRRQDFGLTYTTSCVCGWTDGRLTLRAITIDGSVADWAGVLADPDNNACDGTDSTDRDWPIQSTGRNLARIAWTWNATISSMYTQRVGQANNTENFIYYADTSNDGNMQTGEPVIVAAWQGCNQIVKLYLYTYNAVAPGGDPLVGGTGYADGYHLPGMLTQVRALTDGHGDTTGTQMEWAAAWSRSRGDDPTGDPVARLEHQLEPGRQLPPQPDRRQHGGLRGRLLRIDPVRRPHPQRGRVGADRLHGLSPARSDEHRQRRRPFRTDRGLGRRLDPGLGRLLPRRRDIGTYEPGTDLPLTDTDADGTVDSGSMTSGQVLHFFVAVTPPGPPTAGDATVTTTAKSNFAGKCGGGTPPSRSAADQVHILAADLQMTKTDGVTSAVPGTSLTYTITVTNAGPDTATGAAVADTFNPSWFNVPGISWTCAITTGTGSCQAASGTGNIATSVNLDSGAVATFTVTAPILAAATGTISNTATVTTPADRVDPAPGNNSATDADTVLAASCDMQATKTDGLVSAVPGTSLTYTITVTNAGPSSAVAAPVTDALNAAIFNVAGASWTCAITAGSGACGAASGTGALSTTVGLGPAATATYTITAPILSSATGTISNTVTAGTPPGASDPIPANNSATDGDTVLQPTGDLSITKTDGVASYTPGSTVTYTIVVGNSGPSDVTGATVTDAVLALPQVAGASWTCAAAGGATCTAGPARETSPTPSTSPSAGRRPTPSSSRSARAPRGTLSTRPASPLPPGPSIRPGATTPRPTPIPRPASRTSRSPRPTGSPPTRPALASPTRSSSATPGRPT